MWKYIYVTWCLSLLNTGYYACSLWGVYYCYLKIMSQFWKDRTKIRSLEVCSSISSFGMYQLYSVLKTKLLWSSTRAQCESVLLSAWPHFLVLPTACVDTHMSSWEPDLLKMHAWTTVVCAPHCPDWVVLFGLGCFCYLQHYFGMGGWFFLWCMCGTQAFLI